MAPDYGRPLPDILNSKLWRSLEPVRDYVEPQALLTQLQMAYYTYNHEDDMPFDVEEPIGKAFTWRETCQGHAFWSAIQSLSIQDIDYAIEILEELLDD